MPALLVSFISNIGPRPNIHTVYMQKSLYSSFRVQKTEKNYLFKRATAKTLNQGVAEIDLDQVGLHNTYELNFFHAHFRHM